VVRGNLRNSEDGNIVDSYIAISYNTLMKTVLYTSDALKDLKRHGNMATRVRTAINEYAADQLAHANNVTEMVGSTGKRMRISSYRVLFEEDDTTITVTKIAPRGGVYD
jgi:mRNA interferase RelE/StbE